MSKLKVVHLVESLEVGGVEEVVASMVRHLDRNKYDVSVWCVAHGGVLADELVKEGYVVDILGIPSYYHPLKFRALVKKLKEESVDVLHVHGFFPATLGRWAGLLAKVPTMINHVHTTFYNMGSLHMKMDRWLNKHSFKVIYISKAAAQSFQMVGYSESNDQVIYNACQDISFANRDFNVDAPVAITVGSLTKHKGHEVFLKSMPNLLKQYPGFQWWLVGDGPEKEALSNQVRDLDIEGQVSFLGKRRDVPELLAQAHVYVCPSLREGLGVSVVEAAASGLPVVASRVGGIPEVVQDGKTGFLIEPQQSLDFQEKVKQLLNDPTLATNMSQAGRRVYEEIFAQDVIFKQLEDLYDASQQK